jgi:hypothetical protein
MNHLTYKQILNIPHKYVLVRGVNGLTIARNKAIDCLLNKSKIESKGLDHKTIWYSFRGLSLNEYITRKKGIL